MRRFGRLTGLFTWSNGLRLIGAAGFVSLILSPGPERVTYMIGCLVLATFGLPGAIRFDRESQKEKDPET